MGQWVIAGCGDRGCHEDTDKGRDNTYQGAPRALHMPKSPEHYFQKPRVAALATTLTATDNYGAGNRLNFERKSYIFQKPATRARTNRNYTEDSLISKNARVRPFDFC